MGFLELAAITSCSYYMKKIYSRKMFITITHIRHIILYLANYRHIYKIFVSYIIYYCNIMLKIYLPNIMNILIKKPMGMLAYRGSSSKISKYIK